MTVGRRTLLQALGVVDAGMAAGRRSRRRSMGRGRRWGDQDRADYSLFRAGLGLWGAGQLQTAYVKMINEQGGLNGRKLRLISLDDAY
jgi:branched-chain amino acid transport system substrate-binding protein